MPPKMAPSANSVLRTLKTLSVDDDLVKVKKSGINYTFNLNSKQNVFLI